MTTWKEVNDIYKKHENMRNRLLYSVFFFPSRFETLTTGVTQELKKKKLNAKINSADSWQLITDTLQETKNLPCQKGSKSYKTARETINFLLTHKHNEDRQLLEPLLILQTGEKLEKNTV
ncbi:hypothetical protein [Candidatus Coxiella mudrowiae]|uniref:hypothetical protein n=1 Tax=Candidatus Coxiella mudrowiae TaxID=2054173 RepID=UPI0012FEA320|nr:hypothetical protein [Candidatus Coxiella mudrowiae]